MVSKKKWLGSKLSLILTLSIIWIFALWKNHIGFQCDEAYNIAQGDMVARGNSLFKEIWSYLQMSAVFSAPVIWAHTQIFGSMVGVLLTFRILSVLIQTGISIYFYVTFVRGGYKKRYVLFAAVLFFLFVPDFLTFLYKTEIIWFAGLEIIFTYRFYQTKKKRFIVLLGIMIAASVLAYPTAIIQFPVYLFILYKIEKERTDNAKSTVNHWMVLSGTCIFCAILFFVFVFSRISLTDFILYFPRVFQDDSLDSAFLTKLIHPVIKYIIMGCMVSVPIILCIKNKGIQRFLERAHLPIIGVLLLMAFLGQCYVERKGITWHCLTYPYVLTLFLLPLLCYIRKHSKRNKEILCLFELPACTVVLCMALASNQGNMTSMYGSIFSVMGLMLALGDVENEGNEHVFYRERNWVPISLLVFALLMSIPVWDQESVLPEYQTGNIWSSRIKVTYGPAKGCLMGIPTYQEYDDLCRLVEREVEESDKLLIIDSDRIAAYGYMHASGDYATFSPQGGHKVGLDETLNEYFDVNPQCQPTLVIVNLTYIGMDIDSYLENTSFGKYLDENMYELTGEQGNYVILRKAQMKNGQ